MEEAASRAVDEMAARLSQVTQGKVTATDADRRKWWNQIMGQALGDILNPDVTRPIVPSPTAPTAPTTTAPRTTGGINLTVTIQGLFLAPDRSIAEQLARILKPELDNLVRVTG